MRWAWRRRPWNIIVNTVHDEFEKVDDIDIVIVNIVNSEFHEVDDPEMLL